MNWYTFWADTGEFLWVLFIDKVVPIVTIILVVAVLRWLLNLVINRMVNRIVSGANKTQKAKSAEDRSVSPLAAVRVVQRSRTLGSVLNNIVNVVLSIVGMLLIVYVIDENILRSFTLLTAAIGAGLGFGARDAVLDTINGLFMVLEDQLGVGDIVDLGVATGIVERVGIRITQVRDVNGTLWFVRNGEILRVGNMSQGWARVIIDVSVPHGIDTATAEEIIQETALTLAEEAQWKALLLDKPEVWGLEAITADASILRLTVKTGSSSSRDDVARELRMRLKESFDEHDMQLPELGSTVLTGFEHSGSVHGTRRRRTKNSPSAATGKVCQATAKPATGPNTPEEKN